MMRNNQSGFTLVELAVATAVTGILILVIMGFTINSFAQISVTEARGDLIREAQFSLDTLTEDARLSSNSFEETALLDPNAPNSDDKWAGDESTLILATAAQDKDRKILFADPLQYSSHKNNKVYFVNNGTLYRRTIATDVPNNALKTTCPKQQISANCPGDSMLANNVSSFIVKYYDNSGEEVSPAQARSIEVTLKLEKRKYSQDIKAEYKTRTVFRNE